MGVYRVDGPGRHQIAAEMAGIAPPWELRVGIFCDGEQVQVLVIMTAECRRVIRNWLGSKMTDDSYSNAIVDVVREGVEMLLRDGLNPREENWIQFIPELVEKALPAVAVR